MDFTSGTVSRHSPWRLIQSSCWSKVRFSCYGLFIIPIIRFFRCTHPMTIIIPHTIVRFPDVIHFPDFAYFQGSLLACVVALLEYWFHVRSRDTMTSVLNLFLYLLQASTRPGWQWLDLLPPQLTIIPQVGLPKCTPLVNWGLNLGQYLSDYSTW